MEHAVAVEVVHASCYVQSKLQSETDVEWDGEILD